MPSGTAPAGVRLLRIVIVQVDGGAIGMRVFFSTDATVTVPVILETYPGRWAIEVCFRDLKQLLGFGDSSARKRAAVERTAPSVGLVYTTLVLWFAEDIHRTRIAAPPLRPWYRHKQGLCFADVLRAAQRALMPLDVLDPTSESRQLTQTSDAERLAARIAARTRRVTAKPESEKNTVIGPFLFTYRQPWILG